MEMGETPQNPNLNSPQHGRTHSHELDIKILSLLITLVSEELIARVLCLY